MSLPEEWGGLGLTYAEEVLLFRELGRNLGPLSLLAGVLAARVTAGSGPMDLAGSILNGEAVGLVVPEPMAAPAFGGAARARLLSPGKCEKGVLVPPSKAPLPEGARSAVHTPKRTDV